MQVIKLLKKQDFDEYRLYYVNEKVSASSGIKDVNDDKLKSNLARAKREMKDILLHNLTIDSSFITLTYENNEQNYEKAEKDFKTYIKKLTRKTKTSPVYLCTKELQKRGAIHYHIIFFNYHIKNIPSTELFNQYITTPKGKLKQDKNGNYLKSSLGIWPHGFGNIKFIQDHHIATVESIGNYFSKYIANQLKGQLIGKNKKMYTTSRGIKRTESLYIAKSQHIDIVSEASIIVRDNNITKLIHQPNTFNKYLIKYK